MVGTPGEYAIVGALMLALGLFLTATNKIIGRWVMRLLGERLAQMSGYTPNRSGRYWPALASAAVMALTGAACLLWAIWRTVDYW